LTTRILSWNVNGIRAACRYGMWESLSKLNPDIICLQETRADLSQAGEIPEEFHVSWNAAAKKGYSGTAIFSRTEPISVRYGLDNEALDQEGRVITAEFNDFILINVYTPNSQRELLRLPYRMQWDEQFRSYVYSCNERKPVIVTGDLNVAHEEIDLANPKTNRRNAGFTDEERAGISRLLGAELLDSFRVFHKGPGHYSWWSQRANARARNIGWRIDYVLIAKALRQQLQQAQIHQEVMGSDHCPVSIDLV
jgi:exodeoxyribonuclease III